MILLQIIQNEYQWISILTGEVYLGNIVTMIFHSVYTNISSSGHVSSSRRITGPRRVLLPLAYMCPLPQPPSPRPCNIPYENNSLLVGRPLIKYTQDTGGCMGWGGWCWEKRKGQSRYTVGDGGDGPGMWRGAFAD